MAHCPHCGSHRLRRRQHLLGAVIHAITGLRHFKCSKCGWKGWKGREHSSAPRASARRHSSVASTSASEQLSGSGTEPGNRRAEVESSRPNTFYRSRRYDRHRHHRGRARLTGRLRRLVGSRRRETPTDVLKAVLIVLALLAVVWGGSQACSMLRPPVGESSQQ